MPHTGNFPPKLSPLSIPAAAFVPYNDIYDFTIDHTQIFNRTSLEIHLYYAPVILPHGATVSKVTLYGYRNDALAAMTLILYRVDPTESVAEMAMLMADWTLGAGSIYDDTIDYATIDNENYQYILEVGLDPNDDISDVRFFGAKIEFRG